MEVDSGLGHWRGTSSLLRLPEGHTSNPATQVHVSAREQVSDAY